MSDLSACTMNTGHNLTVIDDTAAYTGSQCNHDNAVTSGTAALPHLTKGCHIGIIASLNRKSGHLFHVICQIHVSPMQIYCSCYFSLIIYRSRYTDSNTCDLFLVQILLADLLQNRLCHIRQNGCSVILCSGRNLPLFQKFSFYCKKTAFYCCSSNVNSKYILLHSACSPAFFNFLFSLPDSAELCYIIPVLHCIPSSSVCGLPQQSLQ